MDYEKINEEHIKNILNGGTSLVYDVEKIRAKYKLR